MRLLNHSAFRPYSAARARSPANVSRLARAAALGAILLAALAFRARDLHLAYASFSVDEARLALVAHGVVEHGWPVLPSGHTYTRGLFYTLLTAFSLLIVGSGDIAPRLPSVLCGVLLVGVMYLYGLSLAGRGAGLLAAALAAVYMPLIIWSRQAWFYSTLVLLWVAALYLFDRATTLRSARSLLLGSVAFVLALFTHEFAVALVPAVAVSLIWWVRDCGSSRANQAALLAVALIAAGLALLAAFTLTLRSETLGGPLGEVDEFVSLGSEGSSLDFYGRMLVDQSGLLLIAAAGGLCLAQDMWRRRLLLPLIAIMPLFLVLAFVLPSPPRQQYGLALMPPLFLLAAAGVAVFTKRLGEWLPRQLALCSAAGLYVLLLWPHLDVHSTLRRTAIDKDDGSWIRELHSKGYEPGQLVLTDVSTVVFLYLGRTDFWLRSRGYEKFTYQSSDLPRDLHTGAVLVRSVEEFERLVREPYRGQIAWVIGSNRRWQWQSATDRDLREYFEEHATQRLRPRDNTRLYMLRL